MQSPNNPSAKDHNRNQYQSGYSHTGTGSHHTQALRNANHDAYQEQHTSPRIGGFDQSSVDPRNHAYDDDEEDDEDDGGHARNGMNGMSHNDGYDHDDGNDSQDEDMDDDLLDKISSSPSIEDGKPLWPTRADSLCLGQPQSAKPVPTRGNLLCTPSTHGPLNPPLSQDTSSHQSSQTSPKRKFNLNFVSNLLHGRSPNMVESSSIDNLARHLLPIDDPFLDSEPDLAFETAFPYAEDIWSINDAICDLDQSSDDCCDTHPFDAEPRFLDSGWGGECLRDTEDIDFEFVYALHTFVATVEGQANATKGDTMVLLDDSNSYWWLVRVVKDGSIGE